MQQTVDAATVFLQASSSEPIHSAATGTSLITESAIIWTIGLEATASAAITPARRVEMHLPRP